MPTVHGKDPTVALYVSGRPWQRKHRPPIQAIAFDSPGSRGRPSCHVGNTILLSEHEELDERLDLPTCGRACRMLMVAEPARDACGCASTRLPMAQDGPSLPPGFLQLSIPTRDPVYYIPDGNTVLLVDRTLFRVRHVPGLITGCGACPNRIDHRSNRCTDRH